MFSYKLSDVLEVPEEILAKLDDAMVEAGYPSAIARVEEENKKMINKVLETLDLKEQDSASKVREALFREVEKHEQELFEYVGVSEETFDFEKVAKAAREISAEKEGFFLKKEYAKEILLKRPPENTMKQLGYDSVEEMLEKEDIGDLFSALRFTETDEWMHKTFDVAYSRFTSEDFERRPVDLRVLGEQYKEVAKKYVAKKRHNVSHLKEFGIIFLNPIAQSGKGKFIRDFALLRHYFHEIEFYSKLFERASKAEDFNERFLSLLRGDVPEKSGSEGNDWPVIQRYLWKDDPEDQRLFLPRVNPEAIHWTRAEQDLVELGKREAGINLDFWDNLSWVAGIFGDELVSFEIEDNAMMVADRHDGKESYYFYHQREAMWNKIFSEYVGGEDAMYEIILENISKGAIKIGK